MDLELEKIWQSKARYRRKLAALPIAEKLRILDQLRERTVELRAIRSRNMKARQPEAGE